MQYIHPKKNSYAMTGVASCIMTFVFGLLTFRRHGLGTDWARIKHLCMGGEYRTIIEAGAMPENGHLPPHLRLDKLSYLDRKDTEIAFPPLYNAEETNVDRMGAVRGQVPSTQMRETKIKVGPFLAHNLSMSQNVNDKYVKRRLEVPESERRAALEEMKEKASK